MLRPSALFVEEAAKAGYDFLFIDGEHGHFSPREFEETIDAIRATAVLALVRVPDHDTAELARHAKMRPDALIVPHVSTAIEAERLVAAIGDGPAMELLVIIESLDGTANAEAILAVDGVTGVIVGPNDLSNDCGCRGDFGAPSFVTALNAVERAAGAARKVLGTVPNAHHRARALIERGHQLLILGTDRMLIANAMRDQRSNLELEL